MQQQIVFYDGECGFCNRTVQFVLRHERRELLHFSALQSDYATAFFKERGLTADFSTFYFFDGSQLHTRSTAALKVLTHLKWYWQFARIGWLVPLKWRDGMYNFIAQRRKRIAGNYCVVPTQNQQQRFLKTWVFPGFASVTKPHSIKWCWLHSQCCE